MLKRLTALLAAALVTALAGAADPSDLPDIGSPADTVLTRSKAEAIGRTVLRQMREAGYVLEDPEVAEYVDALGHRIAATAHDGDLSFEFFVVGDDAINAFALPGGYIGVNSGLISATRNESELAGVLSHEIAHVTQKHIARRVNATSQTSILATAAVLAAILLGATGVAGGEAMEAAIMTAQGAAMQQQINYTRSNEYEADRVGMQYLADAGFDPMGMPSFFEVLSRLSGSMGNRVPEFIQTHPLSANRIAETRARAEKLDRRTAPDSLQYELMRARIMVLGARSSEDALAQFTSLLHGEDHAAPAWVRYGYGLALLRAGRADEAVPVFHDLREEDETVVVYHSALAESQVLAGQAAEGLITFREAIRLFPRNRPLTVRYGESLLRTGQFDQAHAVLLDLFNTVPPTPPQVRLIANAANAAGDTAEALYYMSEYHLLTGQLPMAVEKLRQALQDPGLRDVQRARFEARLAEIEPYLQEQRQTRRGGG